MRINVALAVSKDWFEYARITDAMHEYNTRKKEAEEALNNPVLYHFLDKPWQFPLNKYVEVWQDIKSRIEGNIFTL